MKSLDDLLETAKRGTLTNEEISYVVERIKTHKPDIDDDEDLYTLIYTLGIADCIQTPGNIYSTPRGTKHRKLIEPFLNYSTDPSIPSITLKTLCTYWGFTEDYLEELKNFIKGVEWDEDGGVTLTAIGIAGEYLRNGEKKEKKLFQLLLSLWEENKQKDPSSVKREALYEALARISGQDWNTLLNSEKPDLAILEKVQKMYDNMKEGTCRKT